MKTLEELLNMEIDYDTGQSDGTMPPDFRIAVQEKTPDGIRVIVHALGHDSDTLDLWVKGNEITPVFGED